jgi:hypothetical protein
MQPTQYYSRTFATVMPIGALLLAVLPGNHYQTAICTAWLAAMGWLGFAIRRLEWVEWFLILFVISVPSFVFLWIRCLSRVALLQSTIYGIDFRPH